MHLILNNEKSMAVKMLDYKIASVTHLINRQPLREQDYGNDKRIQRVCIKK